jgi:hypothetical protein
MWKLLLIMALPLAPLAAAHSGGTVDRAEITASAPLACEIRATPVSGGVELEGIVTTTRPLTGTYEFEVRKVGRAGTSNSMQSGEFEARPGEEAGVGVVGLSLERGAAFDAKLVLRWQGEEVSCTAAGSEPA